MAMGDGSAFDIDDIFWKPEFPQDRTTVVIACTTSPSTYCAAPFVRQPQVRVYRV
jgi:hypothetical protein